jgi:hypothetical protein
VALSRWLSQGGFRDGSQGGSKVVLPRWLSQGGSYKVALSRWLSQGGSLKVAFEMVLRVALR